MFRYKCGVVSMFELAATVLIVVLIVLGVLSLLGRTGRG